MAIPASGPRGLRSRVDRLVGPVTPDAAFGTYVVGSADPNAELGRHLEREVFGDVFGNSEELLADEYGPYEAASVFVLVVDHRRRRPAGVMRIVVPSAAGLKSVDDIHRLWGREPDDLVRSTGLAPGSCVTWDLATLAVARDYRGATTRGLVSLALWQAIGVMAYRGRADLLVAIIDVPVFRLLQLKLQGSFNTFDGVEPLPYLDSAASVPAWCRPDRWMAHFAEADPDLYRLIIEGRGLEAAVAPPDWDDASAIALLASGSPLGAQTRSAAPAVDASVLRAGDDG